MKYPLIKFIGYNLDNTKEHEINADLKNYPFGFSVKVYFNESYDGKFEEEIYNNITEVHYLYKTVGKRVALESDIHGTGCTRKLKCIDSIEINIDTKKHENY